eukprot:m.260120 g.260120  ORF g.260120 m.260120 type:complete len:402 (-) comp39252_c0_seq1:65-1270(-)
MSAIQMIIAGLLVSVHAVDINPRMYTEFGKMIISAADITMRTPEGDVDASDLAVLRSELEAEIGAVRTQSVTYDNQSTVLTTAMNAIDVELSENITMVNKTLTTQIGTAMNAIRDNNVVQRQLLTTTSVNLQSYTDDTVSLLNRTTSQNLATQRTLLQGLITSNMQAVQKVLTSLDAAVKANTKSVDAVDVRLKKVEAAQAAFQMPMIEWEQSSTGVATKCTTAQHGQIRRVEGTTDAQKRSVVFCNGNFWQRIAPDHGLFTDNRLSGGGCVMRDVHSFSTTSGGCTNVHMKTNIRVRSSVMYTIDFEGYNYGTSRHIKNSATGYTYSGWSCTGSQSYRNYGDAAGISAYCSQDGYVSFQLTLYGSAYYAGFKTTASFLNPTGSQMCGKFQVLSTRCNGRF